MIGAAMPASRGATPSATSATASQRAPAPSAARAPAAAAWPCPPARTPARQSQRGPASRRRRATGSAPWPWPSALTTAMTAAGCSTRASAATLSRTAPRSISTQAARNRSDMSGAGRQEADDVAASDDADDRAAVDDRHVGHVVLVHERRDVLDAPARRHGLELALHHVADGRRRRLLQLLVVPLDLPGQGELDAGEDRDRRRQVEPGLGDEEVLIAQQPDERALGVDHRHRTDALLA